MPTIPKIVADFSTQLTAALAVGGTTASIASNVDDDGVTLVDGLYYFTIDGTNSSKEHISCTKTGTSLTDIKTISRQGTETAGALRAHRVGATVVMTDFNAYKAYMDAIALQGAPDASTSVKGIAQISVAPAGNPIAVGTNDPRVPTADPTTLFAPISVSGAVTGMISPYAGYTAPSNWLLCNGAAVSRATYADLFALICPSGTFTVTIASPAVFTKTGHGYLAGDKLHLTTTGGLPSGLGTNTDYYVISTGLATDTFRVSLTPEGPAINTTGTQSGVHTVYRSAFGKGDGSTTFNVPDLRGRIPVGLGATTTTLSIDSANVTLASPSVFTIPADSEIYQGQKVVLTTTGALPTGFSAGGTYYVIRATQNATTITLASSQANANAGTGVNGSGSQSGIHTLTYTPVSSRTVLGRNGGEEIHGTSITELAAHTHSYTQAASGGGSAGTGAQGAAAVTGPTGGDVPHNNMPPFTTISYIIKT